MPGRGGWDREAAEVARRETLERLHGMLAERVGELGSGREWQAWLRFASSFHTYSFSNTVLIWAQKADATMVSGYRGWQDKGRQVRRGETAIRILGPVTRRVEALDGKGRPILDDHGKPTTHLQLVGVKPVGVFDVSATDGEPPPEQPRPQLLTGQAPPGLWDSLTAVIEAEGFTVSRGDCGGANGITMFDTRQVRVRADVDDLQAARSLCHEAAHVLLHSDRSDSGCRGVREVEVESVAYLVVQAHHADPSQYTFNYVTGWAHQAATADTSVDDIVRATGQRVITTANRILNTTQPHTVLPSQDGPTEVSPLMARQPAVGVGRVAEAPVWERTDRPVLTGAAVERRALPSKRAAHTSVGVRR